MSAFWDGMARANDAAIDTMGEDVILNEVTIQGVVDPNYREESKGVGGRKTIVDAKILLPARTHIEDGMPITVRGADGKVDSWEQLGPDGHVMVTVGSVNRWSGEIPGV